MQAIVAFRKHGAVSGDDDTDAGTEDLAPEGYIRAGTTIWGLPRYRRKGPLSLGLGDV